jgi:hypothetical protein
VVTTSSTRALTRLRQHTFYMCTNKTVSRASIISGLNHTPLALPHTTTCPSLTSVHSKPLPRHPVHHSHVRPPDLTTLIAPAHTRPATGCSCAHHSALCGCALLRRWLQVLRRLWLLSPSLTSPPIAAAAPPPHPPADAERTDLLLPAAGPAVPCPLPAPAASADRLRHGLVLLRLLSTA